MLHRADKAIHIAVAILIATFLLIGLGASAEENDSFSNAVTSVSPKSSPVIKILAGTISVTQARDGQRFILKYQISSTAAQTVFLGCTLHGPSGNIIEDDTNETASDNITLSVGTNWYQREFFLNVPPGAPVGSYSVEWGVDWGTSGFVSITTKNALKILSPISVRIPILMYHKVGPVAYSQYWVSTASFTAQMNALKAYGYTAVTLYDVMNCRAGLETLPSKPIVITFDDAYQNLLTDAFPVLQAVGMQTVTSFVPTGKVGGDNSWDVGDDDPVIPELTWGNIQQLYQTGMVDFESHTVTHPYLNLLTATQLNAELVDSMATLDTELGYRPIFIAYPYGMFYSREEAAARTADYFAGVDSGNGVEMTCANKWALQRVFIDWNTSVNYDPSNPSNFFFNKIGENISIPYVTVQSVMAPSTCLPTLPGMSTFKPSMTVGIQALTNNSGSAGHVMANLKLSTDPAGANIVYDSNAAGEDISADINPGSESYQWNWTIPSNAALGIYYASITFYDVHYVLNFGKTAWLKAFNISYPSVN